MIIKKSKRFLKVMLMFFIATLTTVTTLGQYALAGEIGGSEVLSVSNTGVEMIDASKLVDSPVHEGVGFRNKEGALTIKVEDQLEKNLDLCFGCDVMDVNETLIDFKVGTTDATQEAKDNDMFKEQVSALESENPEFTGWGLVSFEPIDSDKPDLQKCNVYYLKDGKVQTGIVKDATGTYYLGAEGRQRAGTRIYKDGVVRYFIGESGSLVDFK